MIPGEWLDDAYEVLDHGVQYGESLMPALPIATYTDGEFCFAYVLIRPDQESQAFGDFKTRMTFLTKALIALHKAAKE